MDLVDIPVVVQNGGDRHPQRWGSCVSMDTWRHVLRAAIIGILILTSQTLLQTWYAVSPSEFESAVLFGLAVAFGES